MRKITYILTTALLLFCLASHAQNTWEIIDTCKTTVVDPNVQMDVPSDNYLDITKAWIPADTVSGKPKYKGDPVQFDNMRNGNFAVFHLNITKAGKAKIDMQVATKKGAASLEFVLFNANHDVEFDQTVSVPNNGNWNKFQDSYFITDNAVTTGLKTLVIIFKEDGGKETLNLRQIKWSAFANTNTYSFYPNIVSDDGNANAGTIIVSPDVTSYIEGTTITVKATPAEGYKFVNWTNADGEVVSTNATYTFDIYEDTDLDANFAKINMINHLPGTVDLNTLTKGGKNGDVGTVTDTDRLRYITDYTNKEVSDTLKINAGVNFAENFREGDFFTLRAKVDKQAKYYIDFLAASKQAEAQVDFVFLKEDGTTADSVSVNIPSTGQWFNYTKVEAVTNVEIPTTVNQIVVYLHENVSKKYTANLMNIRFGETSQDPTKDANGNSIVAPKTPTGINSIMKNAVGKSDHTYNLSGQRVSGSYKGVVIRNGKKYLNK
jgi:hypothetical protein